MATPGRDTRRGPAVGALATLAVAVSIAVPVTVVPAAAATDPAATPPPAAPSIPLPTTTPPAPPPSTSVRPTSAPATTRTAPTYATTIRRYTTYATYPSYRSTYVPPASGYGLSGIPTSAPTQTFVLGTGSIGSLPASTPTAVGTTAAATSHPDDSTDRDIRIFFTVVAVAAFLLVAGVVGLVLTRDGRGRHR